MLVSFFTNSNLALSFPIEQRWEHKQHDSAPYFLFSSTILSISSPLFPPFSRIIFLFYFSTIFLYLSPGAVHLYKAAAHPRRFSHSNSHKQHKKHHTKQIPMCAICNSNFQLVFPYQLITAILTRCS